MQLYNLTKKGRANHPIVSKFPERVWIDFLNYTLTSFETRWMTASPSERSDLIQMNSRASDDKKLHCWVSIAFTESTLDDSELINIANVMKLSPEHQLQGACIIGRAEIAKLLLEQLPLEPDDTEASLSLIMKAFRMAASYGHLDVMNTFVARGYTKSSLWDKLCEIRWGDDVFIKAIKNGHAHIILELLTWVPEAKVWEEMQAVGHASLFIPAASAGLLDVVKELLRLAPTAEERIQLVRKNTYDAFKEAYSHKHFEVIEELYNQISDANERSSILEHNCAQMLMNASKDRVNASKLAPLLGLYVPHR